MHPGSWSSMSVAITSTHFFFFFCLFVWKRRGVVNNMSTKQLGQNRWKINNTNQPPIASSSFSLPARRSTWWGQCWTQLAWPKTLHNPRTDCKTPTRKHDPSSIDAWNGFWVSWNAVVALQDQWSVWAASRLPRVGSPGLCSRSGSRHCTKAIEGLS